MFSAGIVDTNRSMPDQFKAYMADPEAEASWLEGQTMSREAAVDFAIGYFK